MSVLSDDSLEGRGTATRGGDLAARFIAAEMAAIGLEPAGDSGFLQKVPLVATVRPSGTVRLTLPPTSTTANSVSPERRRLAHNVVGILRGTDPALRIEVVIVGAHYDHLGLLHVENGDSVFNGADDNASGTTALLSIARTLATGPRVRRTVVFLASTGEEVGLLGVEWFVRHPAVPLERVIAELEIDMIGRPDPLIGGFGLFWLSGYERSTVGRSLRKGQVHVMPDPRPSQRFFFRSSNIVFAKLGIPAHALSSFGLHVDYHQPSDELREIDLEHMTCAIRGAARAALILANGTRPRWLDRGQPPLSPDR